MIKTAKLFDFLEAKYHHYNKPDFIDSDPIQIPHRFNRKEDIEIAGFLTAIMAWGKRRTIIQKAALLMQLMDDAPYEFVSQAQEKDLTVFDAFKHRTFHTVDVQFFIRSLQHIYQNKGGLEQQFQAAANQDNMKPSIIRFREAFFELTHPQRTTKHISNPASGSAAKRINMFLRWMVRDDHKGVDFGIWKKIPSALLSCPLDVHSGNVARKLGLLKRKQNDWKAVEELDASLRTFDREDPVKYDFALFGLGVFEGF